MLIFFGFDILESNSSNPPVDNNRDKDQRFKSFCQHYKHQWFSFLPGEEKKNSTAEWGLLQDLGLLIAFVKIILQQSKFI